MIYSTCFYFHIQSPNNVFRYEVIGDGDGPSYFFVNQNDGSVTLIKSVLNTGASGYTVRHHNKNLFQNLIIIISIVILCQFFFHLSMNLSWIAWIYIKSCVLSCIVQWTQNNFYIISLPTAFLKMSDNSYLFLDISWESGPLTKASHSCHLLPQWRWSSLVWQWSLASFYPHIPEPSQKIQL